MTNHPVRERLAERVRSVETGGFDELVMDIFAYQSKENPVYKAYCQLLGKDTSNVREPRDIPFLPISLFKTHDLSTNVRDPEIVFESSSTTGQTPSRHAVSDLSWYHANARRGFESVTGHAVSEYRWLAVLPTYTERPNSSLVSMVADFMSSGKPGSTFATLDTVQAHLRDSSQQTMLVSVAFALYDIASLQVERPDQLIIIETGGMKGRRKEPTRSELHEMVEQNLKGTRIWSEYGMTELLSQAWSLERGIFRCAPTLRIMTREISDPLSIQQPGIRGPLNCIDIANIDSCAFLATDDVGVVYADGSFEVFGRLDASELRGCNLMYPSIQ